MPANPVPILDYAPRPPHWQRRSFRRILFALLALILAATGVYWYPTISFRIRLAYWQRQCMNHVIPPDKVILTADPKLVPILLQDPDYVQTTVLGVPGPLAAYSPRCFREYKRMALPSNTLGIAVIFMHGLKSPQGTERLVIAFDRGETFTNYRPGDCINSVIIQPRPLFGDPSPLGGGFTFSGPTIFKRSSGVFADTPRIQFYPGQLDPADPSHFTVRWGTTRGDLQSVFDFRLSPDGSEVIRTDAIADPLNK